MQKLIIRLFFILASAAFANVHGQNITFNHLTTDDGLSQFSVNSLYVDENGILWIGTREGLNRYNGEDIKTYKLRKNDPNSLFCNTVSRIVGNHNERIYLLCTEEWPNSTFPPRNSQLCCKVISAAFTTITAFSSVRKMKSTAITRRRAISTFTINCPAKTWKSFACTSIKVTYGWALPPTACIAWT